MVFQMENATRHRRNADSERKRRPASQKCLIPKGNRHHRRAAASFSNGIEVAESAKRGFPRT
jgi:hypothetical protein